MLLRRFVNRSFILLALFASIDAVGQQNAGALAAAYARFKNDGQLLAATVSLHVENDAGKIIFSDGAGTGMAPASTQKIITAATAYALLGKDFRYKTAFEILKAKNNAVQVRVQPSGDPTLGSWRWPQTTAQFIFEKLGAFLKPGDKVITAVNDKSWPGELTPDGWIWQDIGNYYGAGAAGFNWRENQFDVYLKSGSRVGDSVQIAATEPPHLAPLLTSVATAAPAGTGDNAYVYYPLGQSTGLVRGTIPVNEKRFSISASVPNPQTFFTSGLQNYLSAIKTPPTAAQNKVESSYTHFSPPLDSIVFWFNRRSINLYGEALLKTIAYQKKDVGTTEGGVEILQSFWKEKGVSPIELNVVDGSGLSPLNRVTTKAQVAVLQWSKSQPWFEGFYLSLPTFNSIKMKSGTIRGVKGFCGYVKSSSGTSYTFSFLVNNYNGSAAALVQKMYAVLDVLKTQ